LFIRNPVVSWNEVSEVKIAEIPVDILKKFDKIPIRDWLVELGKIIPDMMENYSKYSCLRTIKKGKINNNFVKMMM